MAVSDPQLIKLWVLACFHLLQNLEKNNVYEEKISQLSSQPPAPLHSISSAQATKFCLLQDTTELMRFM